MTSKPRTVDDLGIDAYSRYARDQAIYDDTFTKDAHLISSKIRTSTSKPAALSEFEQTYSARDTASWALFSIPQALAASPNLFSHEIIPSLPIDDESDLVQVLEDAAQKNPKAKAEQQEEKQILIKCVEQLKSLNQSLTLINSRRNQYQRG